jgi:hypothetical protein
MTTANDYIFDNANRIYSPVNRDIIEMVARGMAARLRRDGFAFSRFGPCYSIEYDVTITKVLGVGAPYLFANNFGPLAPWTGTADLYPPTAAKKYVFEGDNLTAIVLSLFLNAVAEELDLRHGVEEHD